MDLRPPISAAQNAFGLPAVVTPPGGPSVSTTAFWLPPTSPEVPPGADLRRAEPRHVLVLPKVDVPQVPLLTVVSVADVEGGGVVDWRVDSMDGVQYDHWRVVVVPND